MKNHLAESPELQQKCTHDFRNSNDKKIKPLQWQKYFYVYREICHQLASELSWWLRAKLKPVEKEL